MTIYILNNRPDILNCFRSFILFHPFHSVCPPYVHIQQTYIFGLVILQVSNRKKDYFSFQFIKESDKREKRGMPTHIHSLKIFQLENKAKVNNDCRWESTTWRYMIHFQSFLNLFRFHFNSNVFCIQCFGLCIKILEETHEFRKKTWLTHPIYSMVTPKRFTQQRQKKMAMRTKKISKPRKKFVTNNIS